MATVKGQNLRVFIGGKVVAAAQQCDMSLRLNVKTSSTKDDTDDWGEATVVNLSWEVRTQGLVTIDPDRNDPTTLMDRIGQTVFVELAAANGNQNSEQGDLLLAGNAVISDVQITASNQDESTYSVTLTGKKNMLYKFSVLCSNEPHMLITSDNHRLVTIEG